VKIIFKEKVRSCRLLYENEEKIDVSFYVYKIQNNIRFHVALLNNTTIPEWVFDYFLTAMQDRLILTLEHNDKSSKIQYQYKYFYSLIK
jgi:hypothetical protein